MANSIIWKKWINVIGTEERPEYIPEEEISKYDNTMMDDDEEASGESSPVVFTPAGMFTLKPFNDPTKAFNFWTGETNFPISKNRAMILNSIAGVEVLDIFTKYRFRIAVGNNFQFQEVRQNIEISLDAFRVRPINQFNNLSRAIKDKIRQMVDLSREFKYWHVLVLPNDSIDFVSTNDSDIFANKLALYKKIKSLVGGVIIGPGDLN